MRVLPARFVSFCFRCVCYFCRHLKYTYHWLDVFIVILCSYLFPLPSILNEVVVILFNIPINFFYFLCFLLVSTGLESLISR